MTNPETNSLNIFFRYLLQQSREAFQELWRDVRTVRWMRFLAWFGFICWLSALVAALTITSISDPNSNVGVSCLPDGSLYPGVGKYNSFNTASLFQITLGFGEYSFGTAKVIDVIWDIVCLLYTYEIAWVKQD
jgi:hypothetical protein